MAGRSKIEWCTDTWNPIVGCSIVSRGCTNCYAMKMADRIEGMVVAHMGAHGGDPGPMFHYEGTTTRGETHGKPPVWTGKVVLAPDNILTAPLRWKRPRRIFVNSMGDVFHESVPDEWIDQMFAVMALAPQHTFQVLTKRSARMRAYMPRWSDVTMGDLRTLVGHLPSADAAIDMMDRGPRFPLPNVWLGVSAEDQRRTDERVPDLLATPAAVKFVSAEPMLGPIDFTRIDLGFGPPDDALRGFMAGHKRAKLDWIIVGGESGASARPMHPDWARSIRDQCAAAGVPFHFKQWGEYGPIELYPPGTAVGSVIGSTGRHMTGPDAIFGDPEDHDAEIVGRFGKSRAGRLLDGVEHNGMPKVRHG